MKSVARVLSVIAFTMHIFTSNKGYFIVQGSCHRGTAASGRKYVVTRKWWNIFYKHGDFVAGGGVALLYATRVLKDLQPANEDQKRGVEIIKNALKAPTFTIVSNASVDGALVLGRLMEQDNQNLGYDAATGQYVNMVKAGIIDPVKVIRTALLDAASVSMLLTTTEAAIVDSEGQKNPLKNRMPNMDDMEY